MLNAWWTNFQRFRNQYKAVVIVNIISFLHGTATGWLSPTLPILQSPEDTHLNRPITMEELSWIGCLISVGGVLGNFLFSVVAERLGRKRALVILAFPNFAFWMFLMFSTDVVHLFIARFCAGLTGGGLFVVLPVYVADVADPTVRGKLNGVMSLVVSIGVLWGFILVEILPVNYISYVMASIPVLYIIGIMSLPETPDYLLKRDRFEEAKEALWFYKSYAFQSEAEVKGRFEADVKQMQQVLDNRHTGVTNSKITRKDFCKCAWHLLSG